MSLPNLVALPVILCSPEFLPGASSRQPVLRPWLTGRGGQDGTIEARRFDRS